MTNMQGLNPYCNGRKNRIWSTILARYSLPLCLNPYCNGRKNRIVCECNTFCTTLNLCLNPYCNGRKNRIGFMTSSKDFSSAVLILIVMEERIGLQSMYCGASSQLFVLILIVMEERIG